MYGSVSPSGSATVAVLDTGVDAGHPDLASNVLPGTSMLDPGSNGTSDPNGHGTEMAGIVAASTDNGVGMAGIGYAGVTVMPVTVLDAQGVGQDGDIVGGVIWAADHGADVILMAFSSPDFSPSLQEAIDYAWSKGAVLVGAAGNDGSSAAHFPAGDRGVVGVANTDESDALNASTNYGDAAFLAAPGTGIYTTGDRRRLHEHHRDVRVSGGGGRGGRAPEGQLAGHVQRHDRRAPRPECRPTARRRHR